MTDLSSLLGSSNGAAGGAGGTPPSAAAPSEEDPVINEDAWQLFTQSNGPMHAPDLPSSFASTRAATDAPAAVSCTPSGLKAASVSQSASQAAGMHTDPAAMIAAQSKSDQKDVT